MRGRLLSATLVDPFRSILWELLMRGQDTCFTVVVKEDSVEVANGVRVTGRLPTGSSFTVTTGDSQTTRVSSTVEVGADFKIFSASVSLSVSADYTTSSSIGFQVAVDCSPGQYGQIFWSPLVTRQASSSSEAWMGILTLLFSHRYRGFHTPSNTNCDWEVPEDTAESGSNYRVVCLE